MPKTTAEAASSIPDTAIIKVGIPVVTPYPLARNRKRQDIIIAGETAAIAEPRMREYV